MSRANERRDVAAVRARILTAAFEAFEERGYAATSTLEIATRARVSKRELYALVGNKQKMLIAAIGERAKRLQAPADMPMLRDRAMLAQVLRAFGTQLVREVTDPTVVGVFRLAIAEAVQAPEVARTLDSLGREASCAALRHIMTQARTAGLIDGRPADLAEQFAGLLWRDLMISRLLGVAKRPNPRAIDARARDATRRCSFSTRYPEVCWPHVTPVDRSRGSRARVGYGEVVRVADHVSLSCTCVGPCRIQRRTHPLQNLKKHGAVLGRRAVARGLIKQIVKARLAEHESKR